MSFIRTVAGDIDPDELGITYSHEHLIGRPDPQFLTPDLNFTDVAAATRELSFFREAGGRAIVEMTTPDYGRNAADLAELSARTGIHIIAATGYNKLKFSASYVKEYSIDELTQTFVHEIEQGMDGTNIKAGLVKAASSLNMIEPDSEKLIRAAARAHLQTGAPISTHTEAGTMALEQVHIFKEEGVSGERIVIGHIDRNLDWTYHLQLAREGVYLGYDQFSKEKYFPDRLRLDFIKRLFAAGFGNQVLISCDFAKRSYWPSYNTGGGPGLTYILWRIVPWLREAGLTDTDITTLLVDNPARAFQFTFPHSRL